jgi:hypothetical protein
MGVGGVGEPVPSGHINFQQRALALHKSSIAWFTIKLSLVTNYIEDNVKPSSE